MKPWALPRWRFICGTCSSENIRIDRVESDMHRFSADEPRDNDCYCYDCGTYNYVIETVDEIPW